MQHLCSIKNIETSVYVSILHTHWHRYIYDKLCASMQHQIEQGNLSLYTNDAHTLSHIDYNKVCAFVQYQMRTKKWAKVIGETQTQTQSIIITTDQCATKVR